MSSTPHTTAVRARGRGGPIVRLHFGFSEWFMQSKLAQPVWACSFYRAGPPVKKAGAGRRRA